MSNRDRSTHISRSVDRSTVTVMLFLPTMRSVIYMFPVAAEKSHEMLQEFTLRFQTSQTSRGLHETYNSAKCRYRHVWNSRYATLSRSKYAVFLTICKY